MALLTDMGEVACGTIPIAPVRLGLVKIIKKAIAEVATLELFCFLCHRVDTTYAYSFVARSMLQLCKHFSGDDDDDDDDDDRHHHH